MREGVVSMVFAFGVYARPQVLAKALRGFDYLYLVPILCLAMSVTPGKLGELFKCLMLKREVDARYAATVPVVLDERLTDLVAVVLLAAVGVARCPGVSMLVYSPTGGR